jgi:iron complex outermembrane receptor protein
MQLRQLLTTYVLPCLLLLFCSLGASAQTRTVTGTVTAKDGSPVAGASVVVKGSKRGVVTDSLGNFSIKVGPSAQSIVVTSVGYLDKELPLIGSTTGLQVVLSGGITQINDVVVIGYGTQKQKDLVGSATSVTSKDFQQGDIATPEQLIQGKVAGVSITTNGGSPGSGSVIRIRGGASLNASNDPLIVIDGVPLSDNGISGAASPLSLINPNDIESFSILKDAASTAIYGSRASNGVIMITTKRGKSGAPQFNFSTQVSAAMRPKDYKVFSASQLRSIVDTYGSAAQQAMLGTANTDWQKQIYQTAVSTDNNLSVTGGFRHINMPYRLSFGYLDQNGVLKTDNLQREALGLSLTPHLFDNHLKIDINVHGATTQTRFANQSAIGNAVSFDPTQPVYKKGSPFNGYFEWMTNDTTPNSLSTRNPVALLYQNAATSNVYRSYGNIQFDYKFQMIPELHANLNLGYDVGKGDGITVIPAFAAQSYNQYDSLRGAANPYKQVYTNRVGEFYLSYINDIRAIKSNINAIAGYGYYDNYSNTFNYYNYAASHDTVPGTKPNFPNTPADVTLISYYGRLIYTFDNKYSLMGSIRTDGSSRFDPKYRWGVFPSGAFTWKVSEENFLKNSRAVSDLKLRASYGITGNQDGIGYYGYIPFNVLSAANSEINFGNGYTKFWSPQPFVTDLKWEQTATTDVGIDYGFLGNRITGSVDYYYKKTKDLLGTVFIPAGTNFGNQVTRNVGNMTDEGVDFNINATPIQTRNLVWNVGFNMAYNKFTITNLTVSQDSLAQLVNTTVGPNVGGTGNQVQVFSVGYQPYAFYVLQQVYGKDGKPVEGLYVDQNRDGVVDSKDLIHYKSPFAPFTFGFNTSVTLNKWTFSTVLRANVGNYMYNNVASGRAVLRNVLNPSNFISNAPQSLTSTNFQYNQYFSSYYVEHASFLRMDNVGVGYTVGQIAGARGTNLRLSLNCQNVFVITKYTGSDPEIYGGIDNTFYPRPRTFTLGANLGF